MRQRLRIFVLTSAVVLLASPAFAQSHVGVRAGVSGNPDQFVFGGHIETKPLLKNFTFRPNVEIGLGDNVTVVALNIEFAYWIPIERQPWRLYLGGGPAANIYSSDGDDGVNGGFNLLVGAQHNGGLFVEFKIGLADSPELKFMVGYAFK